MPSRNTAVLKQVLESLEISEPHALSRLETLFQDSLLADHLGGSTGKGQVDPESLLSK